MLFQNFKTNYGWSDYARFLKDLSNCHCSVLFISVFMESGFQSLPRFWTGVDDDSEGSAAGHDRVRPHCIFSRHAFGLLVYRDRSFKLVDVLQK